MQLRGFADSSETRKDGHTRARVYSRAFLSQSSVLGGLNSKKVVRTQRDGRQDRRLCLSW